MTTRDIYVRCLLQERVKLSAPKVNKHFKDAVFAELKTKLEGICTKHGYIKQDSIEIVNIQSGSIEMAALNGNVIFDVKFYADLCNPAVGSVIKCRVSNINKFGILAEVKPILEIIIAKNSVNIKSDVDLNTVQIGQDIFVEVVGKKYELMDKRICIIGRIVTGPQAGKYKKSIKTAIEPVVPAIAPTIDEEYDDEGDGEEYSDADADADADPDADVEPDADAEPDQEPDVDAEDPEGELYSDEEDDEDVKRGGAGADFFDSDAGSENFNMFDGGAESGSDGACSDGGGYESDY